ncbi:MAG: hypothetical protein UV20_C0039G0004 [Candidatus Magasanikbacteria bacterium GW2011_GWA2_42_32]|uniref:Uncharacterized protein n=1 Tax=Candidatus Magasanikbacteria bacterium GW2011_GWA2_42_32 TaxID=1619039 RepID=A0A0G0ZZK8_9BACT|nr:MAG: hypothetical protein UV20_C0039G0004 [Candidatus Magasanikbacteria bacterium GW2011_GWA2_42_32]
MCDLLLHVVLFAYPNPGQSTELVVFAIFLIGGFPKNTKKVPRRKAWKGFRIHRVRRCRERSERLAERGAAAAHFAKERSNFAKR